MYDEVKMSTISPILRLVTIRHNVYSLTSHTVAVMVNCNIEQNIQVVETSTPAKLTAGKCMQAQKLVHKSVQDNNIY